MYMISRMDHAFKESYRRYQVMLKRNTRWPHERVEQHKEQLKKALLLQKKKHPTSIVVLSSITIDNEDQKKIRGMIYYDSRALWQIFQAAGANVEVIYISSVKIPDEAITHLLELYPEGENIRPRLRLISLDDSREGLSLAEKVLKRPELIESLREELRDKNSYLMPFLSSPKEDRLAQLLDIPLYGSHSHVMHYESKSGNHRIFEEAGIPHIQGIYGIHGIGQLIEKMQEIWKNCPEHRKFLIKLNHGVSGMGNFLWKVERDFGNFHELEKDDQADFLIDCLRKIPELTSDESWYHFVNRLEDGAVIEIFIEGEQKTSPSVLGHIYPNGEVELKSTQEQILDICGNKYLGCQFPANEEYRHEIQEHAYKVARILSEKGIIGAFSLDFLIAKSGNELNLWAIEINIRQGGTTHPYEITRALTKSLYDDESGALVSVDGKKVYYLSNDNIEYSELKGRSVADFLNFMKAEGVIYNPITRSGVVFHMLGALRPCGKLGMVVIGQDPKTVKDIERDVLNKILAFIA